MKKTEQKGDTTLPDPSHLKLTSYQKFMIAILAFLQFTIVLDFMVLSPLGPFVMDDLAIEPHQFSLVVSAYAFSACISAIATAGFADRFDRKKLLLFFYTGFLVGTLLCAMSHTYEFLIFARIFTGIFGGVIGSVSFAIITDIFAVNQRGKVMGFVQMSFAASQILGLPIGLYLAEINNWNTPFYAIVLIGLLAGVFILIKMQPIDAHLKLPQERNPFKHLFNTLKNPRYRRGFYASVLLATGGFMLMPFGSDFATKNLGVATKDLPILYLITGVFSLVAGPIIGKMSDQYGRFKLFFIGSLITMIIVGIYTNLGEITFFSVVVLNVIMFVGVSARIIPAQALLTQVPNQKDRGAFMSLNSAGQQLSGGVAAAIAGMIVYHSETGKVENYPILGIVVIASMAAAIYLMHLLNRVLSKNP